MRGSGFLSDPLPETSERRGFDRLDLRDLLLEHSLDTGLERHHRVHAPHARPCQPDLDDAVSDVDQFDVAAILLDVRPHLIEDFLHPDVEVRRLRGRLPGLPPHR